MAHPRQGRALLLVVGSLILGCGTTGSGDLPPNVRDPASFRTPAGALAFYQHAAATVRVPFGKLVTESGIFTDELAALSLPPMVVAYYTVLDSRTLRQDDPEIANLYEQLHGIRAQVREARGFLGAYVPDSVALGGHLYALEGYADILLADLFCSGIPLSTVDFDGDFTLTRGYTTAEVYGHALELFDTAFALTADSMELRHLAAIGRARALLALGRYAEAGAAVAGVPDGHRSVVTVRPLGSSPIAFLVQKFGAEYGDGTVATPSSYSPGTPGVADREGINGLDYRASADPRVASYPLGPDQLANTMHFPGKYPLQGEVDLLLADGVEARLIEAEAALHADDIPTWLGILNHLRQTAISPALPDTTDPGTLAARVDLLFRERGFWLYLTAHRQGDLRRLIRQYGRSPDAVYPIGSYPGGQGAYGSSVVFPVPSRERQLNPSYTGCINENA